MNCVGLPVRYGGAMAITESFDLCLGTSILFHRKREDQDAVRYGGTDIPFLSGKKTTAALRAEVSSLCPNHGF